MTPTLIAKRWDLSSKYKHMLLLDFVNGTFFCLNHHYNISSLKDYAKAAMHYGSEYGLNQAVTEGQSLPSFQHFKSTYPEYFI